jgi:small subunit ribosomal protein S15
MNITIYSLFGRSSSGITLKEFYNFLFNDKIYLTLRPVFLGININSLFMHLTAESKKEIFGQYGKSNTDTGSPESQIALFSARIRHLTDHLKDNKKDFSTQLALLKLVGKRRRLLDYLKKKDINRYRAIIKALDLRK